MKGVRLDRILAVGGITALVIVYPLLWRRMISSPAERTGSDFIAFYAAGRVAQEAGLRQVYDAGLQQAVQEEQVGFTLAAGQVLLYNHVPTLVPVLMALVDEDYSASFVRWTVVLAAVFGGGISLLGSLLRRAGWERRQVLTAAAGMAVFFPLFVSLMNGQDSAFTLFGLCLWLFGLLTGRDWAAGVGLALATVRPQISLFLAIPFLLRRGRVFAWYCLAAGLMAGGSALMLGWEGSRAFVDMLLVSAGGEFYGMHESAMVNLVGLLTRAFPGAEPGVLRALGWAGFLTALVSLCAVWRRSRTLDERHYGLAVVLALFFSPHLHLHDLALLLVPLTGGMLYWVRMGRVTQKNASLVPLVLSLCLLLGSLVPVLKFNLPCLLLMLTAAGLWLADRSSLRRSKKDEILP